MAKVMIPSPLRTLTGGAADVDVAGGTVEDILKNLDAKFPGLKARVCDEQGKVRRFVNIYLNEEDVRFLQGEATPVKAGDTLSIIPAIAGG